MVAARDASTGSLARGMGHVGARVVPKSCNSPTTTCDQQSGLVQARKNGADGAGAGSPSSGGPGGGALPKRRMRRRGRSQHGSGEAPPGGRNVSWAPVGRPQGARGRVQTPQGPAGSALPSPSTNGSMPREALAAKGGKGGRSCAGGGAGPQYAVVAPASPPPGSAAAHKLAAALTLPAHRVAQLEAQRQLPRVAVVAAHAPPLRPAKALAAPAPAPMPAPAPTPTQVSWDTSSALLDPWLLCLTPANSCLLW